MMGHGLGKDGWPSDETVIRNRDLEIEQLRARCAELEAEISTDAISRGTLRAELLEKCDRIAELEARLAEIGKQDPVYWGHYDLDMVDNAESADFNVPLYTHAPDSAARIAELEAENAALRKDAERYQWLRSNPLLNFAILIHPEETAPPICPGFGWKELESPNDIDAAIDAAKGGE